MIGFVLRSLGQFDADYLFVLKKHTNAEFGVSLVGRMFYSASTMVCVPTSVAQETGAALGAQAGEKKLHDIIVNEAGFASCRRATETPFNLILEAKAD